MKYFAKEVAGKTKARALAQNHRNIGNLYLTRKDFSMKKIKRILALAIAVMAIACTFSANAFAADHGTETFTFSRDGGTTQTTGQLQLYTGATTTDSSGVVTSVLFYAYGARGIRVADNDNYETYVCCEYISSGGYGRTAIFADSTQGRSSAKAEMTVEYTKYDPLNGQGYLRIYDHVEQICRRFNDGNGADYCSHYYAALASEGIAYCGFDDEAFTWWD